MTQEIDYGRRGSGYIFGAFRPATGEAFTRPYGGRTIAKWVDFLEQTDRWLPAEAGAVYAILDNLSAHRAADVLLFSLAHPRWEFVFQPVYAAYLNLIEPWWKTLRSLALKGRRFETWDEIVQAVGVATAYWKRRRPTGTCTGTRSSGGAGAATVPGVRRGWPCCRQRPEFLRTYRMHHLVILGSWTGEKHSAGSPRHPHKLEGISASGRAGRYSVHLLMALRLTAGTRQSGGEGLASARLSH